MKLLINNKIRRLYPDIINNDLNTNEGIIKKDDYNSNKTEITTHKGVKLLKITPNFKELFKKIKRGPQIITLKDAYFIASQLGLMQNSRVLDAGGGSGAMTCVIANIIGPKGRVVSVELEKRFINIIKENTALFGFKNVEVINKDLKDYSSKVKFDAVNLDMPCPWDYISRVEELLKNGGDLTVYVPNTTQLTIMSEKANGTSLILENVYELIKRDWKVKGSICHPKFKILGHTGFIMVYKSLKGV